MAYTPNGISKLYISHISVNCVPMCLYLYIIYETDTTLFQISLSAIHRKCMCGTNVLNGFG